MTDINKLKEKMKGTCFESISYCCGLEKECTSRDRAIKKLGLNKFDYIKLKDKFDENLLSVIRRKK